MPVGQDAGRAAGRLDSRPVGQHAAGQQAICPGGTQTSRPTDQEAGMPAAQ
jgi:hypothetical protein